MKGIKKSPLHRIVREFVEINGKGFTAFLVFGTFLVTFIVAIEPFFMAKVIAYIEGFFQTGIFPTGEFFVFLGIWICYILVSVVASYLHRYTIADKPALTFHNQFSYKYVNNVYYMTFGEYLSKKTGSIYKNFDR